MKKREYTLSFILALLVVAGISYGYFFLDRNESVEKELQAEQQIATIYKSFDIVCQNDSLNFENINPSDFQSLKQQLPFDLFIYEKNHLVFWTENRAIPDLNVQDLTENAKLITLKNGYYIALKKKVGNRDYVALSLLRYSYSLVNKYLTNEFSSPFNFYEKDIILPVQHSSGSAIKDPQGNTVFKIEHHNQETYVVDNVRLLISWLVVLFAFLFIWKFTVWLDIKYGEFWGVLGTAILGGLLYLSILYVPYEFRKTIFFNSKLYGSVWFNSLGDLLFFLIYILGFTYHLMIRILRNAIKNNKFLQIFSLLTLIAGMFGMNWIIRSIVNDSIIYFEARNLTLFNTYTIVGLNMVFLATVVIVFSTIIFTYLYRHVKQKTYINIALELLFAFLLWWAGFGILTPFLVILHSVLLWILFIFFAKAKYKQVVGIIIVALLFMVFNVSLILRHYAVQKNELIKKSVALKQSRKRDITAEELFTKTENKIKKDAFVKEFFQNPLISYNNIYKRINSLYFDGYYNKFDVSILFFNKEGKAIRSNSEKNRADFQQIIDTEGSKTLAKSLYFIANRQNEFSYIALFDIATDSVALGTVVLRIMPQKYQLGNVYPELLLQGKKQLIPQYVEEYEYAVYYDSILVEQSDEFSHLAQTNAQAYENTRFDIDKNRYIVISTAKPSLFNVLSIFSFILAYYFLVGFLVTVGYFAVTQDVNYRVFYFTFKKRIVIAMLSLVILSFFITGFATARFFSTQYNEQHQKNLLQKQKVISNAVSAVIHKNELNSPERLSKHLRNTLNTDIAEIAKVNTMDINVFGLNGVLLNSSQEGIFTSGLLSNMMNAKAYVQLNKKQYEVVAQDEEIGKLKYLSAYIPILNTTGQKMAYLNVPYFAKEKNLNHDVSDFMIALINVYVLLLTIASILAYFVSNSIAKPLSVISQKLQRVTLTKINQKIDWQANDEIGAIVKEYNRMIEQLDESAKLLAATERDTAWREMAKQIAHEIKNPLTPMKLSIQYLQRATKQDPEHSAELIGRVSKTLIEQIENLADIATAFSSFAKMPKGNREKIDVVEALNVAVDLFNAEKIDINKQYQIEKGEIFADQNQMISVFNNLVKNAIQAVEEKENAQVKVSIQQIEEKYLIAITDNGVGISKEKQNKVFVPNFTTKSSGTGLGLAISKRIVEGLYGKIWFESEENKGTTFYVQIPKYKIKLV